MGERRETGELFALEVVANEVTRRVLMPGARGTDEWGYRAPRQEQEQRRARLAARRRRYEAALAEDRSRPA